MGFKCTLLYVLLLLPKVEAGEVKGPPELVRSCADLLNTVLPEISEGEITAELDVFSQLGQLLERIGVAPDQASSASRLVMDIMAQNADDPIFQSIRELTLARKAKSLDSLVCGLKTGKLLGDHETLHAMCGGGPFVFGTLSESDSRRPPRSYAPGNRPYHVIVLGPVAELSGTRARQWAGEVLSELSQYADTELVQHWILANIKRVRHNLPDDDLFKTFVRFREGRPLIDEAFLAVFLLSRSSRVPLIAEKTSLSDEEFYHQSLVVADNTLLSLQELPGVERVLKLLQIHPDNFFDKGLSLGREMWTTVRK